MSQRDSGNLLRLQPTASKELNHTNYAVSLEADSAPFEPSDTTALDVS